MAKKSMVAKAKREPKFSTRQHNRCTRCGRPRAYYRKDVYKRQVQQQAVEYLVPFAIDKRNITPAFPALPKAAGPLKRGQTFSFEVRVTPKPDYELKSYEPVSITVPPFEIEQAEVEEQIAQIAESYAEFVSDEPHPVEKGDGFLLALEAFQNGEKMDNPVSYTHLDVYKRQVYGEGNRYSG